MPPQRSTPAARVSHLELTTTEPAPPNDPRPEDQPPKYPPPPGPPGCTPLIAALVLIPAGILAIIATLTR